MNSNLVNERTALSTHEQGTGKYPVGYVEEMGSQPVDGHQLGMSVFDTVAAAYSQTRLPSNKPSSAL